MPKYVLALQYNASLLYERMNYILYGQYIDKLEKHQLQTVKKQRIKYNTIYSKYWASIINLQLFESLSTQWKVILARIVLHIGLMVVLCIHIYTKHIKYHFIITLQLANYTTLQKQLLFLKQLGIIEIFAEMLNTREKLGFVWEEIQAICLDYIKCERTTRYPSTDVIQKPGILT